MPVDLTPVDDDLAAALAAEPDRQRETLSLIASENHASDAVLAAQESVLTNKYADALAERLQEHGFELVSGRTDVHFALVDFRETHPDLTGAAAETVLESVGLVANKQTLPGDPRKVTVVSGLRVGTPAVTTRGFDADATRTMADAIADLLDAPGDESVRERARETVADLCARHPLYPESTPFVEA